MALIGGLTFVAIVVAGGAMTGSGFAAVDCKQRSGSAGGVIVAPNGVSLSPAGLTVKHVAMQPDQAKVAATIAGVIAARSNDIPPLQREHFTVTMFMMTTQEATMKNLTYGDRDSLGVFQERTSQGWGKPSQILNVVYSTNKMIDAMLDVSGWQTMAEGDLAQAAERSGFPDAYAQWKAEAQNTYNHLVYKGSAGEPTQNVSEDLSCASSSTDSSASVESAIEFAKSRIGTPYVYGGDEPGGFDCSGLMQWAFGKAGIALPRDSRSQWKYTGDAAKGISTSHVTKDQLQRGDLVFWSSNGTPAGIYHVGMYLGGNKMINAANPQSDILVQRMYYDHGFIGGLRIKAAVTSSSGGKWFLPLRRGTYSKTGDAGQYGPRIHPVTGAYGFHNGVDLAAPTGTPIHAVHSGTVVRAGYDSCWGNYLVVQVAPGDAQLYPHQSRYAAGIHVLSVVKGNQLIGYVGGTGCVTGPHLHFTECTNIDLCLKGSGANGKGSVDPVRWLASKGLRVY
jgi:cell wall-associated NlpC family hydrolase